MIITMDETPYASDIIDIRILYRSHSILVQTILIECLFSCHIGKHADHTLQSITSSATLYLLSCILCQQIIANEEHYTITVHKHV